MKKLFYLKIIKSYFLIILIIYIKYLHIHLTIYLMRPVEIQIKLIYYVKIYQFLITLKTNILIFY